MHIYLKDIGNGDLVKGVYFLKSAQQGTTQRGDPFWGIKIADSSMQVDCKIWAPLSTLFKELPTNTFVSIEAKAQSYRDNIQLVINEFRLLEEDEVKALDLSHFIASSPRQQSDMIEELQIIIDGYLTYKPWKDFVSAVFADPRVAPYFLTAPGAKSVHHAYLHGLLEHTLSVCKNCIAIASLYPQLDTQILIVAALFHDIGKIEELSGALGTEYTNVGKLVGHISLGMEILEPYYSKANVDRHLELHLKHLILSHHGELEYGSPKTPSTAEAFILHYADNIDAKIAQITQAVPEQDDEQGMAWSGWNNLLNRQLCKVQMTPSPAEEISKTAEKEKQELEQCSLL